MTIEERMNSIKSKIKIEDFIRDHYKIDLIEHGNYLKGDCPFKHNENILNKDFLVSPHMQSFYCFKCHNGGDILSFISLQDGKTLYDSLVFLEKHYWKNLACAVKNKMVQQEPYVELLKELQEIQTILIENNCI